jgi:hypothetical protein
MLMSSGTGYVHSAQFSIIKGSSGSMNRPIAVVVAVRQGVSEYA